MDKTSKIKILIFSFLILFLYHPYLLLLFQFGNPELPKLDEITWAFKNSLIQTFASTFSSLFIGSILTIGILYLLQNFPRYKSLIQWSLLFPSLLPSLVIVTYYLKVLPFVPPGNLSIVLVQSFVGSTLVASIFSQRWKTHFSGMSELALLEGCSRLYFLKTIWPLIAKDWFRVGAGLTLVFWTSFAVPLLIGGNSGTNLEVLIFEKIRVSAEWNQALGLSLLQISFLGLIFFFTPKNQTIEEKTTKNFRILPSKKIAVLSSIFLVAFMVSLIAFLFQGLQTLFNTPEVLIELEKTASKTVFTFFFSFAVFTLLFAFILFLLLIGASEKILRNYLAPSTALLAVAYTSTQILSSFPYLGYLIAACFYFFIPGYQLYFQGQWQKIQKQISAARLMGASHFLIFTKVVWPQFQNLIYLTSFISSSWLILDFTLPRYFLNQNALWSSIASSLLQTYRTDAAFGVLGLMIIMLSIFFLIFQGVRLVANKRT